MHLYGFGPASSFCDPSNWSYQGCYDDTNATGLFEVRIGSGSGNYSIDTCIAEATSRNLSLAGLRNGGECYAGNSWSNKTVITSRVSQCTMTCGGNSTCGGGNSVSVFAVGEKKGVPVGPITNTSSVPNSGSTSSSGLSVGAIVGIVAALLVAVAVVVVPLSLFDVVAKGE